MGRIVITLLSLVVAAPAYAQERERPLAGDLAKLQGAWKGAVGPQKDVPIVMEVKGPRSIIRLTTQDGLDVELVGEIKLDEKTSPKRMDMVQRKLNGDEFPDGETIYKLDGDTLTICGGGPSVPRPTEFKASEDGQVSLIVFTRVKDAPRSKTQR